MATVNLIDPYSQQAEEIARRQRMAQALQESGSQVLQMPTTPGVAISPYAGLAKILEAGLGSYQEKKARQDYAKLQNEYRDKYNTQFGDLARAISAPAQEAFAGQEAVPGQEAIPAQPAKMAPQIEKSFGGYGMPREVGQYEVSPAVAGKEAVPGQPAIPARPALPAGYISPETLQGIDIPEVKQLAMAKYLAQFEQKAPIKGSPGDVFFDPTTGKERFSVLTTATATKSNIGNVNPSDYTPESLAKFSTSQNYGDLVLKPSKADKPEKLIANINADNYTPESVAKFALSSNYGDLVLKPAKVEKTPSLIGNVTPDSYTPESLAKFALSSNYGDLVLKLSKAEQPAKLIGNVSPSDFTPASLAAFNLSGKYEDLVPKPSKAEQPPKLIANVNPSDYTPESIKAFSLSSDYADLVLKPSKADKIDKVEKTISNINADSYTPESVQAFAVSGNYNDLVRNKESAGNKIIANVNPNDFTTASIQKFVVSGNYNDLVRIPEKVGGGGEKPVTGSISVIDPTDPAGKRVILVTQARAIKEGLTPASSTKEGAASEGERKAATLLQRLQFSQSQLTDALVADPNAAKPGVFSSAVAKLSTPLANSLTPEARQRVQSAQLDILDAALTLGTGAAYTREQLEGYREAYFPQLFDKPNQILDKQKRLDNVINAAKIAAGRAAQLIPAAPAAAVGGSSAMSAADAIINKGRR